jgi:hypothetical protein
MAVSRKGLEAAGRSQTKSLRANRVGCDWGTTPPGGDRDRGVTSRRDRYCVLLTYGKL